MDNKLSLMQERWKNNGIPVNAGSLAGMQVAGSSNQTINDIRSGKFRGMFSQIVNKNTDGAGGNPMMGAQSFQALPEPKVGRDKTPVKAEHKVELQNFSAPNAARGSSEAKAIESLFGGGGGSYAPSMGQPQAGMNGELNMDAMYAQKGGDYFDPRQMIMQRQQRQQQQHPMNQPLDYNQFQNQQVHHMGDPMAQQMMGAVYGDPYAGQQQQPSQYMQYSQASMNMNEQKMEMEEIARRMTMEVLSEYKKQENKKAALVKVKHRSFDNLVKDPAKNQYYLMEYNSDGFMDLRPVKIKK